MSPKRKQAKKKARDSCVCGNDCHDKHAHLQGVLLVALGLVALPATFGLMPGVEFVQAWPLALVMLGAIMFVKVSVCRSNS